MNQNYIVRPTAVLLVLLISVSCRFEPLSDGTPPLTQLSIFQGEVSNWVPEAPLQIYIGDELYNLIDGGAPQYLDKGCIKTGVQRLVGTDDKQVGMQIMDFGNIDNATAMWKEMQVQNTGNTIQDLKFSDTTIFITPVLGGVIGYVHFENYYFEVTVTGFADQILAIQTLDLILGLYQKKLAP